MPWDYIRDEVAVGFPSAPFGDEAFIVDDSIYVRRGETIFWVSGRGIDDPLSTERKITVGGIECNC